MDTRIERNLDNLRAVRNGGLVGMGIALACLMAGIIPGTSEQVVRSLEMIALNGGVIAVGAEAVIHHAEPSSNR